MDFIRRRLISAYHSDKKGIFLEYSASVVWEHVVNCVHYYQEVIAYVKEVSCDGRTLY